MLRHAHGVHMCPYALADKMWSVVPQHYLQSESITEKSQFPNK